jgi:hypothetical protein
MVMVINVNTTANASRTLAAYKALAAKASVNLPGGSTANGTTSETPASGTDAGTGAASSPSASASASANATGAATSIKPSEAITFGGLLALGAALFL